MSSVRLIVKQELVLNLIYLFPECKEKPQLFEQQFKCLILWYFTKSKL